jgi:hypothetical protein
MRKTFNDPGLQKQFDQQGYVKVPFIDAEKVEKLKQFFFDTLPSSGGQITPDDIETTKVSEITYDFTFIDKNPAYKELVFDYITKEFANQVEKYLDNYKPIIANYIRKKSEAGEVPVHQNWAFVNERRHTSVSIWCPLVDSSRANGTLEVIPGSHKRFGELRGPMVPWELEGIKQTLIDKYMVPIETKAGDAVILDDSLVHYSRPNSTTGLRLAIQLILIPAEVNSIHYYLDYKSPGEVVAWEVDKNFYMQFNPWKLPEGKRVTGVYPFTQTQFTEEQFVQRMKEERFDLQTKGFFSKIREAIFN